MDNPTGLHFFSIMKPQLNIFVGVTPEGSTEIKYVHTDGLDTSSFGPKVAPRVSDIEFDDKDQIWVARLRDGTEIARDVNRQTVIDREREIIDGMIERKEPIPGFNQEVCDACR